MTLHARLRAVERLGIRFADTDELELELLGAVQVGAAKVCSGRSAPQARRYRTYSAIVGRSVQFVFNHATRTIITVM